MKRFCLLMLCLCACLSSLSCADKSSISAEYILNEILSEVDYKIRSDTSFYSSLASEGEEKYFSDEQKKAMFGDKRAKECFARLEEYALYVCPYEIKEIAIFKCYSSSDTDSVAAMCLERADALSVVLNSIDTLNKDQKAHVEIHGKYVLFSFADLSESIIKRFVSLT